MGTGSLTKVATPYRVKFAHQIQLFRSKLTLPLGYLREAAIALTSEYSRGTGALASAAALTAFYAKAGSAAEGLRGQVGYNIRKEYKGAVLFVDYNTVISKNAQPTDCRSISLVYGRVVCKGAKGC